MEKQERLRGIERDFLGRILVARILEMPLAALDRHIKALEAGEPFQRLVGCFEQQSVADEFSSGDTDVKGSLLGRIDVHFGQPFFCYTSHRLSRRYYFRDDTLDRILRGGDRDQQCIRVVHQLLLVNTRNMLTAAVLKVLLEVQADYFRSGDLLDQKPLSQSELARRINAGGFCHGKADKSRISRLLRDLNVQLACGSVVPLASLCPKVRDLNRRYVLETIRREQMEVIDRNGSPYTDQQIAAMVGDVFGARVTRRTVAYLRRDLGIPDCRERPRRSGYLNATQGFTQLLTLDEEVVRTRVPEVPGVYEIRIKRLPLAKYSVIYIGSSGDLRKRLLEHLRGKNRNPSLTQLALNGSAYFRYRTVEVFWRDLERETYLAFYKTFGGRPLCNRMSP